MAADDSEGLVVLSTVTDPSLAHIMKIALNKNGIECEIDGGFQAGYTGVLAIRMLVPAAQAEQARALTAPQELDADHRAFVQNTADQSARWAALAATPADDAVAFGALRTEILQLTLGRDDLAVEMGVAECRRSGP